MATGTDNWDRITPPVTYTTARVYMSREAIDDAMWLGPQLHAWMEYILAGDDGRLGPLTMAERITGLRSFTASNGVTIKARVGWRAELHDVFSAFARDAWPEDFVEECDL